MVEELQTSEGAIYEWKKERDRRVEGHWRDSEWCVAVWIAGVCRARYADVRGSAAERTLWGRGREHRVRKREAVRVRRREGVHLRRWSARRESSARMEDSWTQTAGRPSDAEDATLIQAMRQNKFRL